MTPFEQCEHSQHNRTRSNPDGFRIIEDCDQCRLRFIMPSTIDPPDTMPITIYRSVVFSENRD